MTHEPPFDDDWGAALNRLQGQALESYPFRFGLLRLLSWPSLPQLPEDVVPVVARICALLARKPTAASLVPLTLGLSEQQVYPLIELLRLSGHVEVVGGITLQSGAASSEPIPTAVPTEESGGSSFIAKIWQRLGLGS